MSVVREEGKSEKTNRVSQRQYKSAIKSRRPTIRTDLAHRLQFHLILSRSPLLFFARCPSFSLLPSLRHRRRMCSLGQFCLPCASGLRIDRQTSMWKFWNFNFTRAQRRNPSGNRPPSEFDAREFEKKRTYSSQLRASVFAKRIYIRLWKMMEENDWPFSKNQNKKCKVNQQKNSIQFHIATE